MAQLDNPLVSISCVTYNHEHFIRDCLEGFLNQKTNFSYEILIHDDASSDKTAEIIKDYQTRFPSVIRPLLQKENQYSRGQRGINLKFNFPRARGKYIALCEGDDYWTDPLKLQKQIDFLERHPDYVLAHHDAEMIDEEGKSLGTKQKEKNKKDFTGVELMSGKCILALSLCFRNILKDYPEEIFQVKNGDTFLVCLLGQYGKGKYMDTIKPAVYRFHSGGVWSMKNKEYQLLGRINTYEIISRYFKKIGNEEIALTQHKKAQIVRKKLIRYCFKNGLYFKGLVAIMNWELLRELEKYFPRFKRV